MLSPPASGTSGCRVDTCDARPRGYVRHDCAQELHQLEAATLLQLKHSLRNAAAMAPMSLSCRKRESLLIPQAAWMARRGAHLRLTDCPRFAPGTAENLLYRNLPFDRTGFRAAGMYDISTFSRCAPKTTAMADLPVLAFRQATE